MDRLVAEVQLKGNGKYLEIVDIDEYWFVIPEEQIGNQWKVEEVEVRGVEKFFKARIYRDPEDSNVVYIDIGDVEDAGELEFWV